MPILEVSHRLGTGVSYFVCVQYRLNVCNCDKKIWFSVSILSFFQRCMWCAPYVLPMEVCEISSGLLSQCFGKMCFGIRSISTYLDCVDSNSSELYIKSLVFTVVVIGYNLQKYMKYVLQTPDILPEGVL